MLLSVMPVSACTMTGAGDCAGWRQIRLDAVSINGLTDRDAASVLAHNEFGRERGCW